VRGACGAEPYKRGRFGPTALDSGDLPAYLPWTELIDRSTGDWFDGDGFDRRNGSSILITTPHPSHFPSPITPPPQHTHPLRRRPKAPRKVPALCQHPGLDPGTCGAGIHPRAPDHEDHLLHSRALLQVCVCASVLRVCVCVCVSLRGESLPCWRPSGFWSVSIHLNI
jgi:hypothetical protein